MLIIAATAVSFLQPGIGQYQEGHQDHHAQGQGIPEIGVMQHIAADLGADQDGGDIQEPARQGVGRGIGAEGIAKQQDERGQQRRRQHRQGHHPPVLKGGRAQALGRLAPLFFHPFQRGRDN
jgi:hypothetical protein